MLSNKGWENPTEFGGIEPESNCDPGLPLGPTVHRMPVVKGVVLDASTLPNSKKLPAGKFSEATE